MSPALRAVPLVRFCTDLLIGIEMRVLNELSVLVSHTECGDAVGRKDILEAYAKGCGWNSAEQMRAYYPIDSYQFVDDCATCGNEYHAHLACSHCGSGI